ncbi:MAG: hypothetical protein KBD65_03680 [Candidatus Moranbacteria bacterium]|nr:hypothetical protein [Candidatus Moranbacteria bacterium]
MNTLKTRFFLFLFVVAAFTAPLTAVMAVEKAKRAESLATKEEEVALAQKDIAFARYQYYLDISDQKNNLKQAMEDAKAQYEQLLKEQPDLVKAKQTTVNQTTIQPVVTQKLVDQQVTSSKPKTSTKTKTS